MLRFVPIEKLFKGRHFKQENRGPGETFRSDGGAYIKSLKPSDFRVLGDSISQKLSTFAADGNPPRLVNEDGSLGPLVNPKGGEAREDLEDSYILLTYYPDPSNQNEGYRVITAEIVPDVYKRWRVRHKPGYRPNWHRGARARIPRAPSPGGSPGVWGRTPFCARPAAHRRS